MYFRVVLLCIILFFTKNVFSQATDLFISEYIEGSSNNKYIEIYNGTGASVNLADYQIRIYSNGAGAPSSTIALSGTLVDGAVYVVANNLAAIYGSPDLTSGSLNFNGDDAVELYKISTTSPVDIFGNIGCDPGSAWTSTNTTVNKTLVRNSGVCSGITVDDATSCPFNTLATEWTQYNQDDVSDLGSHTSSCTTCSPDAQPTTNSSSLSFSNIGCNSIDLSWTSGNGANRIVVASTSPISGTPTDQTNYNANSFGAGDVIAAGEYVVYNGSGNSFTVAGLSTTTTYYFAIFEYNGVAANCTENYLTTSVLTGDETTISCTNAEITGILVDACGGSEGIDEFFTFTNGSSSLDWNDLSVDFPNGETFCNSGCGTKTWVTNPTYVAQLNTDAGCPGLFVEADPVPANAKTVVFTGSNPSYNFDFSGLCGTGPYYAIFANNTNTGGRFGNYNSDCSQYRTLTVDFGGGYTDDVTYQRCQLSNTDGDYVAFDAPGNDTYSNDGCTPVGILPITLINFNGNKQNTSNLLYWTTSTEINNDFFTIEKSENAIDFEVLDYVDGAGNSNIQLNYQLLDYAPYTTTYYRLKQTDFDGNYSYSNIIVLTRNNEVDFYYSNSTHSIVFKTDVDTPTSISVYSVHGQLIEYLDIKDSNINSEIPLFLSNGLYLISINSGGNITSKKIVVNQ